MKKSHSEILIQQIDSLQSRYNDPEVTADEIKALQGVERCLELKMKIWGFDGKNPQAEQEQEASEIVIDITKLSKQALQEIAALSDKKHEPKNL